MGYVTASQLWYQSEKASVDNAYINEGGCISIKTYEQKQVIGDFPGGAVVRNPPDNTGENGFEPWFGKIPHATEQPSLCATTTEPACHNCWSLHA